MKPSSSSSSSPQGFLHVFNLMLNPFSIELSYFVIVSLVGFLCLKVTKPRTLPSFSDPQNLDVFFTSVSATTISSMSTIEMEVFSNTQLVFMTILMFLGGEVFTSMLGLHLLKFKIARKERVLRNKVESLSSTDSSTTTKSRSQTSWGQLISSTESKSSNSTRNSIDHLELGMVIIHHHHHQEDEKSDLGIIINPMEDEAALKLNCLRVLAQVVLSYLIVVLGAGSALVSIYITLTPSAKQVLNQKGLNLHTFSIFTVVATFVNCGFVPTNENMMVFKKNSGLLLILIFQILLGNTLYPCFLRVEIWVLERITKREVFKHILKNKEVGYSHLLPSSHTTSLAITGVGFIFIQYIVFCSLEWYSEATAGLSTYEKMVGSLFQVANSRHTGESVFDLSALTPAVLVLFIVMMYLPPYTCFLPIESDEEKYLTITKGKSRGKGSKLVEDILFSQLSYLVIFIILICITERDKMKNDPLNFNVFNVVIEVISAYGNVGYSMGYSCARQVKADGHCKDGMYGFVGKWSNKGKLVLIVVMFFGRLKKYNKRGGKAWKLL